MAISITPLKTFHNRRLFAVKLHGNYIKVTVTDAASIVRKWLSATLFIHWRHRANLIVGLGVQWTPGGRDSPADTLQLCVGRRCLIFQLTQADSVPRLLRRFLLDPNHTFVGFWNHSDRKRLLNTDFDLEMSRDPLDLRLFAESDDGESLATASVEVIVEEYLGFEGVRLRRDISRSNWHSANLSEDQIQQACLDAYCAFLMGRNIRAWEEN